MSKKLFVNFTTTDITLEQAFEKFQINNKSKGLTEETLKYYERCIRVFGRFIYQKMVNSFSEEEGQELEDYMKNHSDGIDLSLMCQDINQSAYTEYSSYLLETSASQQTAKTHLVGIKAFFNFAMSDENKYIPSFNMKIMKVDEVHKEPYSVAELTALLKKPNLAKCDFAEYRTWVMENLYYATGMRLGASLDLKIKNVDLDYNFLTVERTKRRKSQHLKMSAVLVDILKEYMEIRKGNLDDYLFPSQFGTRLDKRSAEQAVENYNKSRGVTKKSIHLFRHTFAKDFLQNGGKINELQAILDHSTSIMSMKYASLYDIEINNDFDSTCPLDKVYSKINQKKIKALRK